MARPWYARYPGDYLKDTNHLSLAEHGAYALMLDWYYANRSPLPVNVVEIYRLCSAITDEDKVVVQRILRDYFELTEDGDGYRNGRADDELQEADRRSQAGRTGGVASGAARNNQGERNLNDSPNDQGNDSVTITPTILQAPQPQPQSTTLANARGGGTAVPPCPHNEIIELYHRLLPMGTQVKLSFWKGHRAQSLLARWREDKERQTVNWWEQFFTYCAKSKFLTGKIEKPGREPFLVTLDWLLKPTNFAKINEGYYNR